MDGAVVGMSTINGGEKSYACSTGIRGGVKVVEEKRIDVEADDAIINTSSDNEE